MLLVKIFYDDYALVPVPVPPFIAHLKIRLIILMFFPRRIRLAGSRLAMIPLHLGFSVLKYFRFASFISFSPQGLAVN
ncbi:hypothetical protein ES705_48060 [subsurface metagenome]